MLGASKNIYLNVSAKVASKINAYKGVMVSTTDVPDVSEEGSERLLHPHGPHLQCVQVPYSHHLHPPYTLRRPLYHCVLKILGLSHVQTT